jgi:hypothetical protein
VPHDRPTCPACGRTFHSLKGRSGHLATFNDGTHASYRQAHGMKAPLGPDHKPTKAGARVRARGRRTAPKSAIEQPVPATPGTDNAGDLQRALQELTEKALEANRAREQARAAQQAWHSAPEPATPPPAPPPTPAPTAPPAPAPAAKPEPASQPPAPPSKAPGEGWLIAGGATAAGLGLAALVKGLKGANAPKPEQFPDPPTGRPPMALPDGIWATPEAVPETTGNDWLDQQLGYSGGVKHLKHTL